MEAFQLNTKKSKQHKCDKNKQLHAAGRNDSPNELGEHSQSVIRRGSTNLSAPPPPLSFYAPFLTEKVPLSNTFYWQMTPPLTAVNALFFWRSWINTWAKRYSWLLYSYKMHLLFIPFDFSYPSIYFNWRNPYPFVPEAWTKKKYSFQAEATGPPHIGHSR